MLKVLFDKYFDSDRSRQLETIRRHFPRRLDRRYPEPERMTGPTSDSFSPAGGDDGSQPRSRAAEPYSTTAAFGRGRSP